MKLKYFLPDAVYGANDGIITTFAIVAGVVGANLSVETVFIIGVASLFADGFSMATSNYLASESEDSLLNASGDTDDPFLANTTPQTSALVTFITFIVVGMIPLIPYIFFPQSKNVFTYTIIITLLALFTVGVLRNMVMCKSVLLGGMKDIFIGGIAASIAFFVGQLISTLV